MNNSFWHYPLLRHHKLSDTIRPLIKPLSNSLGIHDFTYFSVSEEGLTKALSSNPVRMEEYLYQSLFLDNPFLRHPDLSNEGVFCTKCHESEDNYSITFIRKEDAILQGYSFLFPLNGSSFLLPMKEIPLLDRYCNFFEQNARRQIFEIEAVDIRPFFGDLFYPKAQRKSLSEDERREFLAQLRINLPKLSTREKECLSLYRKGETAQSIAQNLDLSSRTVESYLENIKNKLSCMTRKELIQKANELFEIGLLLP